jgi:hypothetical protein
MIRKYILTLGLLAVGGNSHGMVESPTIKWADQIQSLSSKMEQIGTGQSKDKGSFNTGDEKFKNGLYFMLEAISTLSTDSSLNSELQQAFGQGRWFMGLPANNAYRVMQRHFFPLIQKNQWPLFEKTTQSVETLVKSYRMNISRIISMIAQAENYQANSPFATALNKLKDNLIRYETFLTNNKVHMDQDGMIEALKYSTRTKWALATVAGFAAAAIATKYGIRGAKYAMESYQAIPSPVEQFAKQLETRPPHVKFITDALGATYLATSVAGHWLVGTLPNQGGVVNALTRGDVNLNGHPVDILRSSTEPLAKAGYGIWQSTIGGKTDLWGAAGIAIFWGGFASAVGDGVAWRSMRGWQRAPFEPTETVSNFLIA